jgi:hypothetical protein
MPYDVDRLLRSRIHAVFDGEHADLPDLCLKLLEEQKQSWADCSRGYALLDRRRERWVRCQGFSVVLQHNPGRMKSTVAAVADEDIRARACFLCSDSLPAGQKAVLFRKDYLILCNPMPVFARHFTVASLHHRPQAIAGSIRDLLRLIRDFGCGWTVLYNGPRCGASAPDHLHFQVVPAGVLPVEQEIQGVERFGPAVDVDGVVVRTARNLGREVVSLESDAARGLAGQFLRLQAVLAGTAGSEDEPMLNIAGSRTGETLRLLVFPRRAHRPRAFFFEGDNRILVSPAAVEMGGVIVTPRDRDFERLESSTIEEIYREVSAGQGDVKKVVAALA